MAEILLEEALHITNLTSYPDSSVVYIETFVYIPRYG
jgi:hypothetical protein